MATKIQKRIGKAQAREEFSSLIESVTTGAGAIEITDYGKVKAVLLSEREYEWLCACAQKNPQSKGTPRGLVVLTDDQSLEEASKQIQSDFEESINKTAREL